MRLTVTSKIPDWDYADARKRLTRWVLAQLMAAKMVEMFIRTASSRTEGAE